MELLTYCEPAKWQGILEKLGFSSKLVVSLTDAKGGILLTSSNARNPLCNSIRNKPEALKFICSQTNTAMTQQVHATREPVIETCEAGMLRIAIPVIYENEIVGQITGCGVMEAPEEIDAFYLSKQIDITEENVSELMQQITISSKQSLLNVATDTKKELLKINL